MKQCVRCDAIKDHLDFYANDRTCKECRKALVRANRAENAEYYKEYDRNRMAALKVSDPEAYHRKVNGGGTPESRYVANQSWRGRNREKVNAQARVHTAVQNGSLIKPNACERCSQPQTIEAHHPDYSKPLDVIWLCDPCHKLIHVEERAAKRGQAKSSRASP